jgi:glucose dehydrogenase
VTGRASTVAYAADSGATLWQNDAKQGAVGLAFSPDSSAVYVTASDGSQNEYWLTTAYDTASGAQVWRARYSAPQNRAGAPAAVVVSPDGHQVIVGGTSRAANGDARFQVFAYDASTGAQLWAARYGASGDTGTSADAMTITPNGAEVIVTGSVGSFGDSTYVTAGFDATTGARLWQARLTGLASSSTIPVSVAANPQSTRVFVTGGSIDYASGSREYLTVAYHS